MSKETNEFLENECMKVIIDLTNKFPNNMDLGAAIRSFVYSAKSDQMNSSQMRFDFENPITEDIE